MRVNGVVTEAPLKTKNSYRTLSIGADIKTVSGMLGHYSAGFTLDTYAHVTTTAQRQAADVMGNVLSGAF